MTASQRITMNDPSQNHPKKYNIFYEESKKDFTHSLNARDQNHPIPSHNDAKQHTLNADRPLLISPQSIIEHEHIHVDGSKQNHRCS